MECGQENRKHLCQSCDGHRITESTVAEFSTENWLKSSFITGPSEKGMQGRRYSPSPIKIVAKLSPPKGLEIILAPKVFQTFLRPCTRIADSFSEASKKTFGT